MDSIIAIIEEMGILPMVTLEDSQSALPLARALVNGGLPAAEITFRSEAAEKSIEIISNEYPNMLVGAGTVLTPGQAERAVKAGAQFITCPGFDPELVRWCLNQGIPVFPGALTPSEVIEAYNMGLRNLKFFPAEQGGGLPMIKALCSVFTDVRFIPVGGINASIVEDYLKNDRIIACGCSWMVTPPLIHNCDFRAIEVLAREAADIVSRIRPAHH